MRWWLHPFCVTQQWCFSSVPPLWQASSKSIPSCGAPLSHHLRLSPCSRQQFSALQITRSSAWPCLHWWTHISGWDMQGYGSDSLCRCHSVLPATDWLLHSPLSPQISPSVTADLSVCEGASLVQERLLSFSSPPPPPSVPSRFLSSSFSLLFSFILPGYTGILLFLLGVLGLLLVFSMCSVRIVPFVDVFLMCLWGEVNSKSSCSSTI